MKRSLFILLITCLLILQPNAKGQPSNLSFQHLTTLDDLPLNMINALLQDSKGFIWIGTNEGLVRYDGSEMKVYKAKENPSFGLVTNWVIALYEDLDSNLVIIYNGGMFSLYDPKAEKMIYRDTFLLEMYNTELYALSNTHKMKFYDPVLDSIAKSGRGGKTDWGRFLGLENSTTWAVTDSKLWVFNEKTKQASEFPFSETNRNKNDFTNVFLLGKDHLQGVWLLSNGDLIRYDPAKKMFETIFSKALDPRHVRVLLDSQGRVWFSHDGLYVYDIYTKKLTHFQSDPDQLNSLSSNNITALMEDDEGRIWVGTQDQGINIFDPYLPNYQYFLTGSGDSFYLSSNNVSGVLETEKGLWVNTQDGYINYLDFETNTTKKYPIRLENSGLQKFEGPVLKDEKGHIYICDWRNYTMFYFDEQLGQFNKYKPKLPFELSEFMHPLPLVDAEGFHYYQSHITAGVFPDYNNNEKYNKLCPLIRFHPETGEVKKYYAKPSKRDSLCFHFINNMAEYSRDRSIWIGTRNGLSRFDPSEEKFENFFHDPYNIKSLSTNNVLCPYEDSRGNIWLSHGNNGGLSKIPVEALESDSIYFERIHTGNSNLRSNYVSLFHEDQNGYLWLITQMGPSRYDYKTNEFQSFKWPLNNNITVNFFWSSISKSREFYFGTTKGLFSFHPDSVRINLTPPRVYLTNLLINDQKVPIKGTAGDTLNWETPLEKSILFTKKIKLPYWQNDFFFDFTAINFTYGKDAVFNYRLDNYDENWKTATAIRSGANYTNMPPGKYTFRVKVANHSGTENTEDALLFITITPPWYWNLWSKTIYLFLILLFGYFLYRYLLKRELTAAENRRLKELDAVKTQLYTNITHEFRTPLTVISGMADQIEAEPDKWFKEGLRMIRRNSQKLLSLVNQMLDLRKLESGSMKINMVQADVIPYLKYLLESFHSYAESKDIRVHFISSLDDCTMDYDPEKLQQIVSNLMSNAIKFTKRGGNVYLLIDKVNTPLISSPSFDPRPSTFDLLIKVKDTGVGIPQDQLENIFDRFYQVDDGTTKEGDHLRWASSEVREGTGIGLSLTKALVQVLGGKIRVKSNPDPASGEKGTEFTIQLPVTNKAPVMDLPLERSSLSTIGTPVVTVSQKATPVANKKELPLALLVEDNADVVQYLISCLENSYQIEVAKDGKEGIEKALELTPDIIISDVMMPVKDGFQLTEQLKTDIRTSHIPIILLTAKADVESKIIGLKRGADAYLPKPFNRQELLVRMEKLLDLRKHLRKHYLSLGDGIFSTPGTDKTLNEEVMEQEFVTQVKKVVEQNLTNYDFSVKDLCDKMIMSHSQLHRKLTALTGHSANQFIRHIRLEKARQMLHQTNEPVSNIAYDTGFKDPQYFSRVFKKDTGLSPTEFRAAMKV